LTLLSPAGKQGGAIRQRPLNSSQPTQNAICSTSISAALRESVLITSVYPVTRADWPFGKAQLEAEERERKLKAERAERERRKRLERARIERLLKDAAAFSAIRSNKEVRRSNPIGAIKQ